MKMITVHVEYDLVEKMLNTIGGGSANLVREIATLMQTLIEVALLGGENIPSLTYVFRKAWLELMSG